VVDRGLNGRDTRFGTDVLTRGVGLSDADRELIRMLQIDGRSPYVDLARAVGLPEKTVRRRVSDMRREGLIHITTVSNPEMLGYQVAAMVGVRCSQRQPSELALEFTKIEVADYVAVTTGRFDIMVELFCSSLMHLRDVVEEQIRAVGGVETVEILPYLSLSFQQGVFQRGEGRPPAPRSPIEPPAQVDRDILARLGADGRTSLHAIAEQLDISEAQVRRRFNRMRDSGTVRVMAITNPMTLGFETIALTGINVGPGGSPEDVAERLSEVVQVSYIAMCAGRYDILAEFVCLTLPELQELLTRDVRTIRGVEAVEPLIYLGLHYKPLRPAASDGSPSPVFVF
jgi:DNA-binding Lrp family transcriptional regulator